MFAKKTIFRTLTVLIVVLMMTGMASASPLSVISPGTAFTYQGRLSDGSSPANGSYDLRFKLFADPTTGSPIGTVDKGGVTVTKGLFTVLLDFGDVFDGTPLYLEVSVGPGYTPLTPRQALTPTPYAIYAEKAPWNGITGIPDGVGSGSPYKNVVVVAKGGGDFTGIQAAIDSITDAGRDNRYLIYVAPGAYTGHVTMKSYVDIQGSGEETTLISSSTTSDTLVGASNAELRFLSVQNTGSGTNIIAIFNNFASLSLIHVTARASGGSATNTGIMNQGGSQVLTNVTATGTGGEGSYGISNSTGSTATMTNVTARGEAGTNNNYGVYNDTASPTMVNVTASALGAGTGSSFGVSNSNASPTMMDVTASASDGANNYGILNISASSPSMTNVIAVASGGTNSYGVRNDTSSPTMTGITAKADSGSTYNWAVYNSDSSPIMTDITASASGKSDTRGVYNSSSSPVMNNIIATATSGLDATAVFNYNSSPIISNLNASASGGSNNNFGLKNQTSSPTISNSVISGSGGTSNFGIFNYATSGTYTVQLNNSQIIGSTNTIYNNSHFTTRVGASQLSGGAVSLGGGTVSCVGVYDENYASAGYTTCP